MTRFAAALYERAGQVGERRRQIVHIMDAALDAVDPAKAVAAHLRRQENMLWVGSAPTTWMPSGM